MGLKQEWVCRRDIFATKLDKEDLCESLFTLTLWPEGSVSGVRVKHLVDPWVPPGSVRKTGNDWATVESRWVVRELAGAWDVAGEWDKHKIKLHLFPRRGGSPLLLRGKWGEREGVVTSVQLEFNSGKVKQGLELVRKELLVEEEGQMQVVRQSLNQLHTYFTSNKLEGFDDLTVAAEDGGEVRSSRLVFVSQSEFFKALLRQEPHTKRVKLSCGGEVLQTIFNFLLTGNLDADPDDVQEVLETADFLGIADLVAACESQVVLAIDLDNCLDVWLLGGQLNRQMLVQRAELFLLRNLQNVLGSMSRSLAMPSTLLNKLLNDSRLCVFGKNGAQLWGLDRFDVLKSLLSKWEGWRRADNPFDSMMETEVLLPRGPDQVQEYIVEKSLSIGRPVRFCETSRGNRPSVLSMPFKFENGGEVAGVTLAWRQTNFNLPVLAGISVHWDTGLTDSVGQVGCT